MKRPGIGDPLSLALQRSILGLALLVSSIGLSVSLLSSAAARSGAAVLATGATPTPTRLSELGGLCKKYALPTDSVPQLSSVLGLHGCLVGVWLPEN